MNCLTPNVDIPEAFKNWEASVADRQRRAIQVSASVQSMNTGEETNPRAFEERTMPRTELQVKVRNRRTVEEESDLTLVTGGQTLDYFLGFLLDGEQSYTNLSNTKEMIEYAKVTYYSLEPEVEKYTFDPFMPNSGTRIKIKGRRFLGGFEPSDYKVGIGRGWCKDLTVTNIEITCAPPDELPEDNSRRRRREVRVDHPVDVPKSRKKRAVRTVEAAVIVHAGTNLQLPAGPLTYHITDNHNVLAIVLGIVCAVLVLVGITAIIVRERMIRDRQWRDEHWRQVRRPSHRRWNDYQDAARVDNAHGRNTFHRGYLNGGMYDGGYMEDVNGQTPRGSGKGPSGGMTDESYMETVYGPVPYGNGGGPNDHRYTLRFTPDWIRQKTYPGY